LREGKDDTNMKFKVGDVITQKNSRYGRDYTIVAIEDFWYSCTVDGLLNKKLIFFYSEEFYEVVK